ncbi:LysR family transcriptional regulator [Paenochrobactrum sp. BZR 588]|uniref:LysR family transcriptional regulator n=1 Tax=unclassified Paenochrobactrum TaxID=2639760 RepID=UPI0038522344
MPEDKNTSNLPSSRLGQLRLLVALDTLLVEGSVQNAAVEMGLSAPAMSRLLNQIREAFGDPIFIRSGRRMLPTPKAEALRLRLRALSAEADDLLKPLPDDQRQHAHNDWQSTALMSAPPLSLRKPFWTVSQRHSNWQPNLKTLLNTMIRPFGFRAFLALSVGAAAIAVLYP